MPTAYLLQQKTATTQLQVPNPAASNAAKRAAHGTFAGLGDHLALQNSDNSQNCSTMTMARAMPKI